MTPFNLSLYYLFKNKFYMESLFCKIQCIFLYTLYIGTLYNSNNILQKEERNFSLKDILYQERKIDGPF